MQTAKNGMIGSEVGMHDHCLLLKSNPPTKERRSSCFGLKRRTVRKVTTDNTKRSLRRFSPRSFTDVGKSLEERGCPSWGMMSVFSGYSLFSCSSD